MALASVERRGLRVALVLAAHIVPLTVVTGLAAGFIRDEHRIDSGRLFVSLLLAGFVLGAGFGLDRVDKRLIKVDWTWLAAITIPVVIAGLALSRLNPTNRYVIVVVFDHPVIGAAVILLLTVAMIEQRSGRAHPVLTFLGGGAAAVVLVGGGVWTGFSSIELSSAGVQSYPGEGRLAGIEMLFGYETGCQDGSLLLLRRGFGLTERRLDVSRDPCGGARVDGDDVVVVGCTRIRFDPETLRVTDEQQTC